MSELESDHDAAPPDSQAAEWIAEIAERVQAGESIDLDALALEHPDHVETLRQLLPAIEALARLGEGPPSSDAVKPLPHALPAGRDRLGDYALIREIGRGGMGVVYEATQLSLRRAVALKVLPAAAALDPRQFERFQFEARAAACLQHAHIVPVYGIGRDGEIPFYVMRLIDGRSLAQVLHALRKAGGSDPIDDEHTDQDVDVLVTSIALSLTADSGAAKAATPTNVSSKAIRDRPDAYAVAGLGRQAAEALDHAHAHGIVHRDIKPANLLVDGDGQLWVTDFGLARVKGDPQLTASGEVVGTLLYMSPEQALGRRVVIDGRTDVYSLGATLYELLTLRPAYPGTDRAEILRRLAQTEPVTPRAWNPAAPRDLETIVLKAMAKEPAERYATAREMAEDLGRFLDGRPILARRPGLLDRGVKLALRNRTSVAVGVALLTLAAAAAAGGLLWSNDWLRRHNQRLGLEKNRADAFARQAETNRALAEQQRDLAEQRLTLSDRYLYGALVRRAFDTLQARQFERTQEILRSIGPRPGGDDPREFAWRLLWRLSRREVVVLSESNEAVNAYALSPDGDTVAVGDRNGAVRLRNADTGVLIATFAGHKQPIRSLVFSPDARRLASVGYSSDVPHLSERFLWDVGSGRRLASLAEGEPHPSFAARFDRSGRYLWVIGESSVAVHRENVLWDLGSDPAQPRPRRIHRHPTFRDLPTSNDGLRVAVVEPDGGVAVVDAPTGNRLQRLPPGPQGYLFAVLSPKGTFVATFEEGSNTVVVWEVDSHRERTRFVTESMPRLRFSGDQRYLVVGEERGFVHVHDFATGQRFRLPNDVQGRDDPLTVSFALASDGQRLAWSYVGVHRGPRPVTVFDLEAEATVATYPDRVVRAGELEFHPDGGSLFIDAANLVRWRLTPQPEPPQPAGHTDEAWSLAFSPNGGILATGGDDTDDPRTLKFWDVVAGTLLKSWKPHDATVSALAFAPDGSRLATASLGPTGNLRVWNARTMKLLADFAGHGDRVRTLAFSPDGRFLASGGADGAVRLWDVVTRKCIRTLEGHGDAVRQVRFHPSGRRLVSVSNDTTLRLWDLSRPGGDARVWRGARKVAAVDFAPDGMSVATADTNGVVTIRDLASGEILRSMHADDNELICLAYAPDGRTLAAAGLGKVIHLWDPLTGQELLTLNDHKSQVNSLAFSPDGKILASCAHDGSVRLDRGP